MRALSTIMSLFITLVVGEGASFGEAADEGVVTSIWLHGDGCSMGDE